MVTSKGKRRIATYERVSSEDQRERQTIKTQTEALARELDRNPDVVLVARYEDDGVSGTVPMSERPGGRQMLADAERGLFDELWVYDLTRLARNTADATRIRDALEEWGIVVSWDGRVVDPFIYDVHAALAAEERRRIRRRSMDGMERAVVEGRYVGGIVPFGYRVEGQRPRGRLVPDDEVLWGDWSAADVVRHMYRRLAVDGWTCVRLSEELNELGVPTAYSRDRRGIRGKRTSGVWRATRIRNLVVSTIYRGEFRYGKRTTRRREEIVVAVPALVDDELWRLAQETLKANRLLPTNTPRTYLLRSKMRCTICGLTYVGTTSQGAIWYRCGGQMKQRGRIEGRCPGKSIKAQSIEDVVWGDIEAWLRDPGALLEELREEASRNGAAAVLEATRLHLRTAMEALGARRVRRLAQHERGLIGDHELESALDDIATEQGQLEARLAELEPGAADTPVVPESLIEGFISRLQRELDLTERQEIVRHLVEGILVTTEIDETGAKTGKAVVRYRFPPRAGGDCAAPGSAECRSHDMHGCPCGYYGDSKRACSCAEATVSRYQRRVSGPLLDRFDLFIEVPRVEYAELAGAPTGESSSSVRGRVAAAREVQQRRLEGTGLVANCEMGPLEVRRYCQELLAPEGQPLLAGAMEQLGLSARAFHRVLKVARTVADLAGSERIETVHLAEAIQYRRRAAE